MRVIVFTTDGLSREDGNVYYSRYLVVESSGPGLTFSEPFFAEDQTKDQDAWVAQVKAAGYKVSEPPQLVVIQPY